MQFTAFLVSFFYLLATALASPTVVERTILMCGTQPYDPNNYTCYPGNFLCPINNGVIYQPCGNACFDPANYTCVNGQLRPVGICNGQVYDKNSYVCVSNHLCPINYPLLCGEACYRSSEYRCVGGKLEHV